MKRTQEWLQQQYFYFNRQWFDGQLPKDTTLRWVGDFPSRYRGHLGRTGTWRPARNVRHGRILGYYITISRHAERAGLSVLKMTLLHEMAHVKTWRIRQVDHGRAWQREMHRLASAGAFDKLW